MKKTSPRRGCCVKCFSNMVHGPMPFIRFAVFNTIDTRQISQVHVPFGLCATSIADDGRVSSLCSSPTIILLKMPNDYSLSHLLRRLFSAVVARGEKNDKTFSSNSNGMAFVLALAMMMIWWWSLTIESILNAKNDLVHLLCGST